MLTIYYLSIYTVLYTYTEFLSNTSDRMNNCDIAMSNVPYHSLYRRLFH